MLKPSIDDLLKKVDSKYTLVVVAARRARNIQTNYSPENVKNRARKPVSMAWMKFSMTSWNFSATGRMSNKRLEDVYFSFLFTF